jgi:hypothetical protein
MWCVDLCGACMRRVWAATLFPQGCIAASQVRVSLPHWCINAAAQCLANLHLDIVPTCQALVK